MLHQLYQFPLLLPGDLVCPGGRVDAPAGHHDRLHTGRQQLHQCALRRVVRQKGKVPGDAVIKLFLAEGRLQINKSFVLVLFHVAQMARRAEGQRPADAEVGEQHLALLLEDGFAVLVEGEGHVLEGEAHHLLAVGVMAHEADKAGDRLHEGVARLPGQLVAVAGGAGGGVAQAARCHQHGVRLVLPARSSPHSYAAIGRAGLFLFRAARIFRRGRRFFRLGQRLQQQLFCPVVDDVRSVCVPQKSLPDLFGLIRHREHPASALHFQLHTERLKQLHRPGRWESPQRREQKAGVRPHMVQKFLCGAVVGHIAAALSGDENFLSRLFHMFQHRHLMPLPQGRARRHQAGSTAAYH